MEVANRVESKRIQQQIVDLQNEKNKVLKELQKVEEQIEKRQGKIEKLNEQAGKTSIKNQVLGKDADRNEYWFYKEEPGKLFVKKYQALVVPEDVEMINTGR
jgi:TolA-binding protein